jgi:hypothetical protein
MTHFDKKRSATACDSLSEVFEVKGFGEEITPIGDIYQVLAEYGALCL